MSTLKVDTLTTTDAANSIATERVANGTAAAWVNFNGTGTVAIRASYNVSSITDIGTGIYTVNFTNNMIDSDYAVSVTGTCASISAGYAQTDYLDNDLVTISGAVNRFTLRHVLGTNPVTKVDAEWINAIVYR